MRETEWQSHNQKKYKTHQQATNKLCQKNKIESLNKVINDLSAELLSVYENLTSLYRIIGHIKSIHEPDKLFSEILKSSVALTKSDHGHLYVIENGCNINKMSQAGNNGAKLTCKETDRWCEWLASETIKTGESFLIENLLEERWQRFHPPLNSPYSSICSLLLKNENHTLGVLNVYRFKNKPRYKSNDFKLLKALADQAAVALNNIRILRELIHQQRIEKELEIAANIQRHLYPNKMPTIPCLDIAAHNLPAHEVGGDYYDLIELNDGLACGIGDVMGKGVPAALFAMIVRSVLRTQFHTKNSMSEILAQTNRFLYYDLEGMEMFLTLFIGFIEPKKRLFRYCNAGHNPVLIIKTDRTIKRLQTEGLLVGVRFEGEYQSGIEKIDRGDIIVFYTDGITEAMDRDKNMWGEDRLIDTVISNYNLPAQEILNFVFSAVNDFSDEKRNDDMTMLIIKIIE